MIKNENELMTLMIKHSLESFNDLQMASVQYFSEKRKVSGSLLIAIKELMSDFYYYKTRKKELIEKIANIQRMEDKDEPHS